MIILSIHFIFFRDFKMSVDKLIKNWSEPDFMSERVQLNVKLPFDDHARLLALKEFYGKRSINDLMVDILKVGMDEIIDALSREKREGEALDDDYYGKKYFFDINYREILKDKQSEVKK
jgi:hypothetical protein